MDFCNSKTSEKLNKWKFTFLYQGETEPIAPSDVKRSALPIDIFNIREIAGALSALRENISLHSTLENPLIFNFNRRKVKGSNERFQWIDFAWSKSQIAASTIFQYLSYITFFLAGFTSKRVAVERPVSNVILKSFRLQRGFRE